MPQNVWKRFIKDNMPHYGETDLDKKVIYVNKQRSKTKPMHKRPLLKKAHRYPEVLDTIVHEEMHRKFPEMTERDVQRRTKNSIKRMGTKTKKKMYALYGKVKKVRKYVKA